MFPKVRNFFRKIATEKLFQMSSALGVLWTTWDNFWQDTSISGVNNAGKARKSALRRIIWIVVFSLGLVGTIWALYTVYADYILYPVTTTITIQHKDKVFLKNSFIKIINQCSLALT